MQILILLALLNAKSPISKVAIVGPDRTYTYTTSKLSQKDLENWIQFSPQGTKFYRKCSFEVNSNPDFYKLADKCIEDYQAVQEAFKKIAFPPELNLVKQYWEDVIFYELFHMKAQIGFLKYDDVKPLKQTVREIKLGTQCKKEIAQAEKSKEKVDKEVAIDRWVGCYLDEYNKKVKYPERAWYLFTVKNGIKEDVQFNEEEIVD
jgi:hypothetical protein